MRVLLPIAIFLLGLLAIETAVQIASIEASGLGMSALDRELHKAHQEYMHQVDGIIARHRKPTPERERQLEAVRKIRQEKLAEIRARYPGNDAPAPLGGSAVRDAGAESPGVSRPPSSHEPTPLARKSR